MEGQQQQHLIDLPKLIAGGVASPLAALLTSRFGVAGTMAGLAVSAVMVTTISDILKTYLARVPGTVKKIPGGFSKKPRWQQILYSFRLPFSKFSSIAPARRRSILTRSLVAGVIVFVIGLIVVTGVEASVGKNLSCWVWKNCPAQSTSTGDGSASQSTSTLPSILGGGQGTISSTLQITPSTPQQQRGSSPPGTPQAPSQTPVTPGTGTPSSPGGETPTPSPSSAQPGQQQGPSSGVSQDQQQTPSNSSAPAEQQPSSSDQQQPSSSDQQQPSAGQQPSSSDQQPSAGQQPSSSDQQPSAGQQPSSDNSGQAQQGGAGGSPPSQQ